MGGCMPAAYCGGGDRRGNRRVSAALVDLEPRGSPVSPPRSTAPPLRRALRWARSRLARWCNTGPVPLRLVYALILADFVDLTLALLAIPEPGVRTGSTTLPEVMMRGGAVAPRLAGT